MAEYKEISELEKREILHKSSITRSGWGKKLSINYIGNGKYNLIGPIYENELNIIFNSYDEAKDTMEKHGYTEF